jgi:hypothetical protein
MHACSTNNDPGFILPITEPIDGNWYNRLSVRIFYEGGFSLADAPGGGMNARILFRTAGTDGYQISQDIVVYPGWNDIDLELGTSPSTAVLEEGTGGPGWANQLITEVRFDPHEDRGVRCFTVDDIKISTLDIATPGFAVKFRDDANGIGAPSGGTTAEVFLDTGRGGFGGTKVGSGIGVGPGVNTFNFTGGVPTGFYWVWVRLTDGNGRQSSAYARAPLLVGTAQPVPGGSTTDVNAGVSGSAALVNLTMTQATRPGYLTADSSCISAASLKTSKSNGNYNPGQDIANLSVIPLGNSHFCIYNNAPVHEVADVQGVFSGNGNLSFSEFAPPRFDTRRQGKPAPGSITEVSTGAPAGTQAVLVNLTMTEANAAGYIAADRCSTLRVDAGNPDKQFSNGNYVVGQNVANLAVVRIDTDGKFCIFTKTSVNVIADIHGRFAPSGSMKFATASSRFDTRGGARPGNASTTRVPTGLPGGTPYALVNLTMTQGGGGGYITADRCGTVMSLKDTKSNGNFVEGRDIANLSVVPLASDGSFCIYTEVATHLIVDVQGSFSPWNSLGLSISGPNRQLDTRR